MKTELYFLKLSDYDMLTLQEEYKKVSSHFISADGEKLSERKESLLGRLLLWRTLEEGGIGEFQVHYKDSEKPELICSEGLCFNISHSADYVMLALSECDVGCCKSSSLYSSIVYYCNISFRAFSYIQKGKGHAHYSVN